MRRCVEEPQQESAAKAAKAQWSAMREDPEATKAGHGRATNGWPTKVIQRQEEGTQ